jgi:hypothetical protein
VWVYFNFSIGTIPAYVPLTRPPDFLDIVDQLNAAK